MRVGYSIALAFFLFSPMILSANKKIHENYTTNCLMIFDSFFFLIQKTKTKKYDRVERTHIPLYEEMHFTLVHLLSCLLLRLEKQ